MTSTKLLFGLLLGASTLVAQAPSQAPDVMIQGFYWDSYKSGTYADTKWTTLQSQSQELSAYFDLIWLPPSAKGDGTGYHPLQWCNQNNSFGTEKELKQLISTFKLNQSRAVADIVVNHKGNRSTWCDFWPEDFGTYGKFDLTASHICKDDEVNTSTTAGSCYGAATGNYDYRWNVSGSLWGGYSAARDLDHTNSVVQECVKAYLKYLKNEIGYDGWRYDVSKGYAPQYVGIYNDAAGAYMSVGEFWENSYDELMSWVAGTGNKSTSFDWCNKYEALNNGIAAGNYSKLVWKANGVSDQPAGLIHHANSKRYAVTFVDNHDTFRDGSKYAGDVLQAYAYLLASPGIPCVFYPHWYSNKVELKKMINARKAVGVTNESGVEVLQTSSSIYVAKTTGTNGQLVVKVGSGSYSGPGNDWTLACSGTNYAMWIKTTTLPTPKVAINYPGGTYRTSLSVKLEATQGATIYYTRNGTTPTTSSLVYSAPLTFGATQTLKYIAVSNGVSSEVYTQNYTFDATNYTPIKVRFFKPDAWTSVNIWAWITVGGTDQNILAEAWPGKPMTNDGGGWWSYQFDSQYASVNLLFNNGAATSTIQTGDIKGVYKSTCYIYAGEGVPAREDAACQGPSAVPSVTVGTLRLFPNPVVDHLMVESDRPIEAVAIYQAEGRVMNRYAASGDQVQLSLEGYPSGLYVLSVIHVDGTCSYEKFIKQ